MLMVDYYFDRGVCLVKQVLVWTVWAKSDRNDQKYALKIPRDIHTKELARTSVEFLPRCVEVRARSRQTIASIATVIR